MSFIAEKLRKEFQAVKSRFTAQRNVPPNISKQQIKDEIPVTWEKDNQLWGYVSKYMLKGSGAGFVQLFANTDWTEGPVTAGRRLPNLSPAQHRARRLPKVQEHNCESSLSLP